MKYLILFLLLGWSQLTVAQKYSLLGQVTDEKNSPLPAATVLVLQARDSALVNYTVTDAQGNFRLQNLAAQNYLLKITFVGYAPAYKNIPAFTSNPVLQVGTIQLQPQTGKLQEVTVHGEKSPVLIKKDTVEFNAGSFKTQPNAPVEDLLKKLPGVQVDNDGAVSVQGEKVKRVTVDGKEFFGQDPKIATKNLPADAVDKVQVFDKKSDQTMFSGIDDGQREKTINLKLKEEKRNSTFGQATAGVGTNNRFLAKANLNRFRKGQQLSFLGMGNNVNTQGFSIDDYLSFSGGMMQMASGRGQVRLEFGGDNHDGVPLNMGGRMNGLVNAYAGGLNFNQQLTKKAEANGSYFLNHLNHDISRKLERENFLPGGNFFFNQDGRQNNLNTSHRANFSLDQKIDSANSVKITGNITYNETSLDQQSQSATLSSDGNLVNQSYRNSYTEGSGLTGAANILFRHRFNKPGRTFSVNTALNAIQNQYNGQLTATNTFYPNNQAEIQELKQTNTQKTATESVGTTLSYTEPLGNRKYLEGNYAFRISQNSVNRRVFNLVGDRNEPDLPLSNQYNSQYNYNRAGVNFRLIRRQYNLLLGTSLQYADLTGNLVLHQTRIRRSFRNILPTARLNYDFTNNRRAEISYETSVQEPSIQQLQPVVENSDPLNLYVGNPNLRPAYDHKWQLNFNTFDPATFISFFSFINLNYTTNAIVNAQAFNENLVRITQPVNVKDNTRLNMFSSVGFPVKKLNSRFNVGINWRQQWGINLLNEVASQYNQRTVGGNIRYEFRYKEKFDFSLRADYSLQRATFGFNEAQKQQINNQTYTAETNYQFGRNFNLQSVFDLLVYDNKAYDFHQRIPLWNLSVSRYLLKNNAGELKLSATNLLNKNIGITQTANVNYVERETLNTLSRYFMVSFTYAINKHLNPMGNRRGNMIRIIN